MRHLKRIARVAAVRLAGMFLVGAALGMAAAAAVVYVAADRLDIVQTKRTVANVVTTVDRNTALNVIAQEGKWYKVEVNGKQGYVFEKAVSNQPGGKKAQGVALSAVKGGPVADLEQAAAVRGVKPGAQQYASSKGLSTSGLQQLFNERTALTPAEYERFLKEGGTRTPAAAAAEGPGGELLTAYTAAGK